MVEIADIEDQETLKAWLEALPEPSRYAVSVAIANRATMRVLPLWVGYFDNKETKIRAPNYTLALFRCTLTSAVAPVSPTADVKQAADAAAAAYAAAADAAYAAAAARAANIWNLIRADCALAEVSGAPELMRHPLWSDDTPEPEKLAAAWTDLRRHLTDTGIDWSFWIDFTEAMRKGRGHRWKLWETVAISPDIDWEAEPDVVNVPEKVNAQIAEIAARYDGKPSAQVIEKVRNALDANRPSIEAQIASLQAMIAEEVERIRGTNPKDDIEAAEKERRLEFFSGLLAIVAALDAALPAGPEATDKEAEEAAGLLATFGAHFKNWPRENAKELVDSTYRVAIVGVCAGAGALFGLPAIGAAIGAAMFGGKKIGDAIGQAMKNPAQ